MSAYPYVGDGALVSGTSYKQLCRHLTVYRRDIPYFDTGIVCHYGHFVTCHDYINGYFNTFLITLLPYIPVLEFILLVNDQLIAAGIVRLPALAVEPYKSKLPEVLTAEGTVFGSIDAYKGTVPYKP